MELKHALKRIEHLEEENETLREKVANFLTLVEPESRHLPLAWELTRSETAIVNYMLQRDLITPEALTCLKHSGQWYHDRENSSAPNVLLSVFIWRIRHKLKPHGISVQTVHGRGYCISQSDKDKIKQLYNV